jgi:hypothetical protein
MNTSLWMQRRARRVAMRAFTSTTTVVAVLVTLGAGCGDDDGSDATVRFETPADGERIAGGVDLAMSAEGIVIEPAGTVQPGSGHFHVIADQGCVDAGTAIARDADHVHVGTGASTATIYLAPGTHSLCLQAGDGAHTALDATDTVEIEVGVGSRAEWCAVVEQVDGMFEATDTSDEDFATKQVGYENIHRMLAQLTATAPAYVDGDAVTGVEQLLDWATLVTETIVGADSIDAATEALYGEDSPYANGPPVDGAGPAWVSTNCGVDVD